MAEWKERRAGRIGNPAALLDAPFGHFRSVPEGRTPFGRDGAPRRGHAPTVNRP
jgi:hypothetical protein